MKRTAIIASAALLFSAAVNAQTDTTARPVTTTQNPVTAQTPVRQDKYNNWSADTYKMQPMPEALTQDKVFPVIGTFDVTNKAGEASQLSVTLDETNKGIAWIDGLPEGRIKATLRKSPATYKIPAQTIGEGKEAKKVAEGVLIYDRDANVFNLCIGCTYNAEEPGAVFASATDAAATDVATEEKKTTKKTAVKSKSKTKAPKAVHYSGTKVIQQAPAVEATEQPATDAPATPAPTTPPTSTPVPPAM